MVAEVVVNAHPPNCSQSSFMWLTIRCNGGGKLAKSNPSQVPPSFWHAYIQLFVQGYTLSLKEYQKTKQNVLNYGALKRWLGGGQSTPNLTWSYIQSFVWGSKKNIEGHNKKRKQEETLEFKDFF